MSNYGNRTNMGVEGADAPYLPREHSACISRPDLISAWTGRVEQEILECWKYLAIFIFTSSDRAKKPNTQTKCISRYAFSPYPGNVSKGENIVYSLSR